MKNEKGNRSCLVREISQYIYDGFEIMQQQGTVEHVVEMIDRNFHHVVYVRDCGILIGVAVFFRVTDSTLEKIKCGEVDLKDPEEFKKVEKEDGDNVHIFSIRADGMATILRGLRDIIKNLKPKTVSWYRDNEMKDLKIIRRKA